MCRLCLSDPELRLAARQEHLAIAARLELLAKWYRKAACGEANPHDQNAPLADVQAVYRHLHEDWVVPTDAEMTAEEESRNETEDRALDIRQR